MFTVIVYHKQTKKVILTLPLIFEGMARIRQLDSIVYNGYDYRVYCEMEPVLYEDDDGDICLKDNAFIVNSNLLIDNNHHDNGLDHTNL